MTSVWHDHTNEYPSQPLTANKPMIVYPKGSIHTGTKDMNMPEETKQQPEWITLSAAADHKDCQVSRQALWNMIKRGDVPANCLDKRPYGSRYIYYINANCLSTLKYRESGQRGKSRDNKL